MTIMFSLVTTVCSDSNACADAITLTAKSTSCRPFAPGKKEVTKCTIYEATRLAFAPEGQQSCMMMYTPENTPLGTLKLRTNKIKVQCQAQNMYFTRSFVMSIESAKKCANSGSCDNNKCGQWDINSKFDELSDKANSQPGFSHCVESCGCWACACFYCTSGCLLYRFFAEPKTETIYEVFSCPVWNYLIDVTATLVHSNGKEFTHSLHLEPGKIKKWKNFEFGITSVNTPTIPLLHKSFVTDGKRVFVAHTSASGQPVAGEIGELQCGSKEKVKAFASCILPHNICQCSPQESRVQCTCSHRELETMFDRPEYVLPLRTQGLMLQGTGTDIYATFSSIASLEIQITTAKVNLLYTHTPSLCTIKPVEFQGCYSCLVGAVLKFTCISDKGEQLAHVSCGIAGKAKFSTLCSENTVSGTASLAFTKADINETCHVSCPGGTTKFAVMGTLTFVEKERLGSITDISHGKAHTDEVDLSHLFNWLKSNWILVILAVLGVVIIIILVWKLLPPIVIACSEKLQELWKRLKRSVPAHISFKEKGGKSA